MKKTLLFIFLASSLVGSNVNAQVAFPTIDSVSINKINAYVAVHGDLWWNPTTMTSHCSFPAGTNKNIAYLGSLWMSGYDAGSNLHIAAQTYRQNGNDYWPGPLDASDALSYATSTSWAKIWKVNRTDITLFLTFTDHTSLNTPAVIWTWPAKGNTHAQGNGGVPLTITDDMAPFVDINNDGIYEPEMGDYPDFKGDQALWWVFSDNGPTHTETKGTPLGVEVQAMAYAYGRGTAIDRVIYYRYTIKNKSANTYTNFRVGQFADMDLGNNSDDYIGIDTTRGLGIIYNGEPIDAVYGNSMPMAGITMLGLAGVPMTVGAASFIYYNNDASPAGNPSTDVEYNNYLRSTFKDGELESEDYPGPHTHSKGYGSGPRVNYIFTGDPSDTDHWSECTSNNIPGDRRFIISSGDGLLNAGATLKLDMALVTTDLGTSNACGDAGISFDNIKAVTDIARAVYDGGPVPTTTGVNTINAASLIKIYPNPAHDKLTIENTGNDYGEVYVAIYNTMGQVVNTSLTDNGQRSVADISKLPAGLYNVLYRKGNVQTSSTFVKE